MPKPVKTKAKAGNAAPSSELEDDSNTPSALSAHSHTEDGAAAAFLTSSLSSAAAPDPAASSPHELSDTEEEEPGPVPEPVVSTRSTRTATRNAAPRKSKRVAEQVLHMDGERPPIKRSRKEEPVRCVSTTSAPLRQGGR